MRAAPVRRRALLHALALGTAVVLPVVALAVAVRGGSGAVVALDESVVRAATDVTRGSDVLRSGLIAWQEVTAARWVNLVLVPAVCLAAWRRCGLGDRALWAGGTVAAGWVLQLAAKGIVQRARPVIEDAVARAPGSSFPSGHATNAALVAVTLTLLVWPVLGRRGRVAVPATAAALVLVTAADRVLLGVHYPSDVVGGVMLGAAVAVASFVGFRRTAAGTPVDDPVDRARSTP
ncbi:phosphatase PAP2 family protein [Cellulomonas phragmiteti]|uniref:Phosphatidic acid phosphatase type 2/haloperoxidase domain-containing protein n=1 Tax=Cellulomonas phragmiteti TaxID=478780 RepID=A0ABQ4DKS4_9CELL|nr:phosphatase PAP2 family protein [Cellulomonas phragmiteti]GIG39950.1 hypothetical protein Cph01nite_17120 [Cellulomonas phragmiteti]